MSFYPITDNFLLKNRFNSFVNCSGIRSQIPSPLCWLKNIFTYIQVYAEYWFIFIWLKCQHRYFVKLIYLFWILINIRELEYFLVLWSPKNATELNSANAALFHSPGSITFSVNIIIGIYMDQKLILKNFRNI